ncbi:MAG: DUF4105 domain-containing protein [Candidatus Marinimicrobia bacterium]|jgi:hypothetical protein|nr:DUF4105 domain-containing protein [Campylobacteraceae bacterium]MBT4707950.1 DUF4105 domain-containing protein [Campylobacteraceae bacterium]MBT7830341.1 DUF4105 domain-containing protein [Candidatus Neomarinimicrobiota bacterium]
MVKIVFSFILLISVLNATQWDKLLHYNNKKNGISSSEFFLSNKSNPSPKEELKATISLLNSKDGNVIACNFPARYEYLKSKDYNIPNFNLDECKELNIFMDSFAKDKVSLVFTSEYVNSPASAFGHTMILFSNDNESINIGDAVHYAAKTPKEGFFKYAYKGSTGKYDGYFIREPFYKKIYEYNTLEQRYMYLYTLDFTKEQIEMLQYHLFELRKATFKYYFMDENCASQTTDLLNVVTFNIRKDKNYYLPIDTIRSYENNVIKKQKFTPLVNKLNLLLEKMTNEELILFNNTIKSNIQVSNTYPDIVKEAMVYYSTFYFRRFHRVFKNYDSAMNQVYKQDNIKDNSLNPLDKSRPSNIDIGVYLQNNKNYLYMHYRPLFIDEYDLQFNNIQQSTVDTFAWDLIIRENNIKLNKFSFVNLKSFTEQSVFYKPSSWALYSGLNRDNRDNKLVFNNELGVGKTIAINSNSSTNLLFYLGVDNNKVYIKPYIGFNKYLSKNIKISNSTYYKKYDGDSYLENKFFITYKYRKLQYTIENINTNIKENDSIRFSVKYNF